MGVLVGRSAPDFCAPAVLGSGEIVENFRLQEAVKGKYAVVFFYPLDFTFVCPTEILAFQSALKEFEKRNTTVIGASCDTAEVHFAWLNTSKNNGGIEGVTFPLLADTNRNLSSQLDILDIGEERYDEETDNLIIDGSYVTYRATYLIDENGKIFHESVNDMPLGRNVQEYLRLIDAYTHVQQKGEVCPANWEEGKDAMTATRDGVATYLSSN